MLIREFCAKRAIHKKCENLFAMFACFLAPLPRDSDVTLFVMGNIVHMDVREVFAVIFLGFEVCVAARTGEIGLIPKLYFPGFTKTCQFNSSPRASFLEQIQPQERRSFCRTWISEPYVFFYPCEILSFPRFHGNRSCVIDAPRTISIFVTLVTGKITAFLEEFIRTQFCCIPKR